MSRVDRAADGKSTCPTCDGRGELATSHKFDCPDCDGTGRVDLEKFTRDTAKCEEMTITLRYHHGGNYPGFSMQVKDERCRDVSIGFADTPAGAVADGAISNAQGAIRKFCEEAPKRKPESRR